MHRIFQIMRKAILYILIFSDGENVLIPNNTNRLFIYTSHLVTFLRWLNIFVLYIKTKKKYMNTRPFTVFMLVLIPVCICELAALLCTSPLAPLAPVFRSEMQAFGINAEVAFLHGTLVTFHYVLRQGEDILTLQWRRANLMNNF